MTLHAITSNPVPPGSGLFLIALIIGVGGVVIYRRNR